MTYMLAAPIDAAQQKQPLRIMGLGTRAGPGGLFPAVRLHLTKFTLCLKDLMSLLMATFNKVFIGCSVYKQTL